MYNTCSVSTNPRTLSRCYFAVGNGNEFPDIHYKPSSDLSKVYADVMSYVTQIMISKVEHFLRSNFSTLFPFVSFDLTKQKMDIKDGVTKLAFHYELSANTGADYNVYSLVLHEREVELDKKGGLI